MWEEPFHGWNHIFSREYTCRHARPSTPRIRCALTALACEPVVDEDETVELTLRLKLGQGYDIGPTPGRVFIYADSVVV